MSDHILAFFSGVVLMALINSISLAWGAPIGMIVVAVMFVFTALTSIMAYCIGKRHEKFSSFAAYNRGVTYGRKLGRAERQSEIQNFLEEDK